MNETHPTAQGPKRRRSLISLFLRKVDRKILSAIGRLNQQPKIQYRAPDLTDALTLRREVLLRDIRLYDMEKFYITLPPKPRLVYRVILVGYRFPTRTVARILKKIRQGAPS